MLHATGEDGASCRSFTKENGRRKRKRSLGCARDDETGETLLHVFFIPLRKPTSAPSGRLLPEEGGRMPPHRLPMKKAYDTRIPLPHIRHFERKREIFFVRGQAKNVRGAESGKHRAPSESEGRCFMQTALRRKTEEGNEKDPSAALGMTKRGKGYLTFFFNL